MIIIDKLKNDAKKALDNGDIALAKNKMEEIKKIKATIELSEELGNMNTDIQISASIENCSKVIKAMMKNRSGSTLTEEEKALLPGESGYLIPYEVTEIMKHRQGYSLKTLVGEIPVNGLKGMVPNENFDNIIELDEISEENDTQECNDIRFGGANYELKEKALFVSVHNAILSLKGEELVTYLLDLFNRRLSVTENKAAISILTTNKTVITYATIEALKESIKGLEPSAKANTAIITNEDGYSKLDIVDSNGIQLITKKDNKFIFNKQYEVITIDNSIYPSKENKAPFIIGDLASAIKFVGMDNVALNFSDKFSNNSTMFRFIKPMDCVKTSNSDKCYIVGEM